MTQEPANSWTETLLVLFGALVLVFAINSGWWYVAHHMAWWTFALTLTGWTFGIELVKAIYKESR